MTEEQKLALLRVMIGGSDADEVLSAYLLSLARRFWRKRTLMTRCGGSPRSIRNPAMRDRRLSSQQEGSGGADFSFGERDNPHL